MKTFKHLFETAKAPITRKKAVHKVCIGRHNMKGLDCTDTYRMYEERIKPYVNFQKCKRRMSAYDRRRNKQTEKEERSA